MPRWQVQTGYHISPLFSSGVPTCTILSWPQAFPPTMSNFDQCFIRLQKVSTIRWIWIGRTVIWPRLSFLIIYSQLLSIIQPKWSEISSKNLWICNSDWFHLSSIHWSNYYSYVVLFNNSTMDHRMVWEIYKLYLHVLSNSWHVHKYSIPHTKLGDFVWGLFWIFWLFCVLLFALLANSQASANLVDTSLLHQFLHDS